MTHSAPAPFDALSPDVVFEAAESIGLEPSGRLFALNSYENRVYQLGDDHGALWVLKFYRPARWSDAQIDEEHSRARCRGTAGGRGDRARRRQLV